MKNKSMIPTRAAVALFAVMMVIFTFAPCMNVLAVGQEDILPSGEYYFLPSGTDVNAVTFNFDASAYMLRGGKRTPYQRGAAIDISSGKATDENGNTYYDVTFYNGSSSNRYRVYPLSQLPTVYIETSAGIGFVNADKNYRDLLATVEICDESGKSVYSDTELETNSELKKRGNATSGYAKKPYQIKLGKKTDLFGMGKAKTWLLLANYVDPSFIRNAVSYDIADSLGLSFTPKSVFVNLYIDGDFTGLYQLIEKTQIGSNRVEISDLEELTEKANNKAGLDSYPTATEKGFGGNLAEISYVKNVKNPDDITGGYLIELDNLYGYREKSRFTTENGNTYVLKSPEFASREQVLYIAKLFSEMEEAIYSPNGKNSLGKHFSEYADVDSLLKAYMTFEITKNWDAYIGSTFFYKDKDTDGETAKIFGGPIWDCDHSYGNLNRMTYATDTAELWAAGTKRTDFSRFFGKHLMEHDECKEKLAEYCKAVARHVTNMTADGGYVDALAKKLHASAEADKLIWGYRRHQDFSQFEVYIDENGSANTAIGHLKDFMVRRTADLYKFFVGETYVPQVTTETTTETATETTAIETTKETMVQTTESATQTTAFTTADNAETSSVPAETAPSKPSGGCRSSAGVAGAIASAAAVLCALALKKKKQE